MKLIGKIDDAPLFEVDEGKYISGNPHNETCRPMWCWFMNMGRWADTFVKCSESEDELHCLDVIEKNKEKLAEALNSFDDEVQSADGQEMLKEQQKFYDWLEEGREYNWFEGYTDEEEED